MIVIEGAEVRTMGDIEALLISDASTASETSTLSLGSGGSDLRGHV